MHALRSILAAVVCGVISIVAACGDGDCDSSECNAGNKCLPFNGETKCRKTCSSNSDPATSCPFGYTCAVAQSGVEPFCVQDKITLAKKTTGQWGVKCQANLGSQNPGCDISQEFYCYGISPADGDAYCTRYGCTTDQECGAGFWCATINKTPNVFTAKRTSVGATQTVCLKRAYCAPCKADVDCPDVAGKRQHCVEEGSGTRACMPECDTNQACPNEAFCAEIDGVDAPICYPRSSACVGDGSLCAPCRADSDCGEDGACVKGEYTTERACAKKLAGGCDECPRSVTATGTRAVTCLTRVLGDLPAGYCAGIYNIGPDPSDLGCWTPNR